MNSSRQEGAFSRSLVFTWIVLIALTCAIYQIGFSGDFFFDDGPNIVQNSDVHLARFDSDGLTRAFFSGSSGPLGRPLAMLSFAINHFFAGLDPATYKLTNLVIHLLTALALAVLTSQIIAQLGRMDVGRVVPNQQWLVLSVIAVWMLHPIQLSNVLYIVQRMNSLAALFTVSAMIGYLYGRVLLDQQRSGVGWAIIIGSFLLFGLLGVLSKENAALLPLYLGVLELTLFSRRGMAMNVRCAIGSFFSAIILLPFLIACYLLINDPGILSYEFREFTLPERLLTQFRLLLWYMQLIAIPDISQMGVFLDDVRLSRSLFNPGSTVVALLAIVFFISVAVVYRRKLPVLSLGILWYFCGHSMESTIFPLELAYEHRNYLPSYGLVLAGVYYLFQWQPHWFPRRNVNFAILGIWMLAVVLGLWLRAEAWSNNVRHAVEEVTHHPESPRAHYFMATIYATLADNEGENALEHRQNAIRHYDDALQLRPSMAVAVIAQFYPYLLNRKSIPSALWKTATMTLSKFPLDSQGVTAIGALTQCLIKSECTLSEQDYLQLVDAALTHKMTAGAYRANVLTSKANYYEYVKKDPMTARETLERALDYHPAATQIQLRLIDLLIVDGEYKEAEKQLFALETETWKPHKRVEINQRLQRVKLMVMGKIPEPE